jgi:hypothetical protein
MDSQKGPQSSLNLDLSDITEPDELASSIETFYKNDSVVKSQLGRAWERTQMMLDGQQWIVWEENSNSGGQWKQLKVNRENEYIPRPVTNVMFDAYQTLKGYLLKTKPRITVRPNTQTHKDKNAAKMATLVSESNYERLGEEENDEYAASVLVSFGTVFAKDYWDTSYVNQVKVPRMVEQPVTDPNTGQQTGTQLIEAVDENLQPIYDMLPLGDVNSDVIEPYRIALDPLAMSLNKTRWIMEYSIQPLEWIKTTYGKTKQQDPSQPAMPTPNEGLSEDGGGMDDDAMAALAAEPEEGYTGRVDEVKAETSLNGSMRRFFQLKTSSGVKNSFSADAGGSADASVQNTAVVKEYYERPTQANPKGRLVVVANGIPLYVGESPYQGPDLGDWHPYSECRWELVPGRFWGKAPLEDAAEIQKKINSIDATIILTRKTMAIPQKLVPLGIGITPGQWTGRPGQEIFYRADGAGGAVPSTVPSSGVHESVFQERASAMEDFKAITGAIDILKGDRPPGVTAASALSMLYEVGTGKLFPVLGRWKRFKETRGKKQLRLVANKYKEPRDDFIRMLMMKNTELSEQEISAFIGEDLYDNCNVTIEAGSNIPKLQAAEQALLLEVAQTGALALDQPVNRAEFLSRLGITGFDSDIGPDTKRAEWENDLLRELEHDPQNKPVALVTDKHAIHIETHGNLTKESKFMAMSAVVQQATFAHIQKHHQMQDQEMQMQQMQAAASGAPPAPPAPPGRASHGKPHPSGNGIPGKMKEAIFGDALVPGQSKGGMSRGPGQ